MRWLGDHNWPHDYQGWGILLTTAGAAIWGMFRGVMGLLGRHLKRYVREAVEAAQVPMVERLDELEAVVTNGVSSKIATLERRFNEQYGPPWRKGKDPDRRGA